ncbi:MAG: pantoate--beta-alanine ligase [Bryobacterales bacterium]|nr:pantoate--beta-alanine ligase [Bryobacterales bacterium]
MIVEATIAGIRRRLGGRRPVALVPTMGALHEGHGALMDAARRDGGICVVSIFVNPIQFDRPDDYAKYTIDLSRDKAFCEAHGMDAIFAPAPEEMYPQPPATFVEVSGISEHLCGRFRPGHFRGVATVVAKLFQITGPDRAYFGEKDAQQLAVIERMVADLNMPVAIVPVPTVREPDGLALSSRNRRLAPEQRRVAPALYRALEAAKRQLEQGTSDPRVAVQAAEAVLASVPEFRVEYLEIACAASMAPVERIDGPVRIAAAAWLGDVRLIDNVLFTP